MCQALYKQKEKSLCMVPIVAEFTFQGGNRPQINERRACDKHSKIHKVL
jgi:hypothetical protein